MKRVLLTLLLMSMLFMPARASEALTVAAKGAVLIDGASGRVLFEQNADQPFPMASTTFYFTCSLPLIRRGSNKSLCLLSFIFCIFSFLTT